MEFCRDFFIAPGSAPGWIPTGLSTWWRKRSRLVPYENLTKILKASSVISAASAMRNPDEVIGDYLAWGTGGTCFSLTASIVAVYDALGVEVYPVLADRRYGVDTHCGLVLVAPGGKVLLLDPGYLLCSPVAVPTEHPVFIDTGYNRMELHPVNGGTRLELYTTVKASRKLRLTFKMDPVSRRSVRKCLGAVVRL